MKTMRWKDNANIVLDEAGINNRICDTTKRGKLVASSIIDLHNIVPTHSLVVYALLMAKT